MAALARIGVATVAMVAAAAVGACGPSRPSAPDAYAPADVGGVPTRTGGADVDAYREVFGADSVVYAVGDPAPDSGLPPALVAVVPLDAGAAADDVSERAFGPGDEVVRADLTTEEGERLDVASASSRQGDITLEVRLWRPATGIAVVVIGTASPEAANAVVEAVAAHVG